MESLLEQQLELLSARSKETDPESTLRKLPEELASSAREWRNYVRALLAAVAT